MFASGRALLKSALARRLLLLSLFAAAFTEVAQTEDANGRRLAAYLELGTRYRAGDSEGAVLALLRWPTADVDAAVRTLFHGGRQLRACSDTPPAIEAMTVESLVLLHLEAIRWLDPNAPPRTAALRHEADTAANVLEWLRRTENWPTSAGASSVPNGCTYRPHITRREFYFTLSGFLLGRSQPEAALRAAMTGLEVGGAALEPAPGLLTPDRPRGHDADLLLAAACAHELRSLLAPRMYRPMPPNPLDDQDPGNTRKNNGEVRNEQTQALVLLRQILKKDPQAHAARLRSGRILWLRRQHEEAEADLKVAAEAPEPATRYLAELFRGGLREELQDANGAAEAYRRATAVLPQAQTARVALGHLLSLAGQGQEARSQVLVPLAAAWSTEVRDDPWWQYPFGNWPEAERLFDELRRRVAER